MKSLIGFLLTAGCVVTVGAGTLYFGAYPNSILAFDEATGKVTDRVKLDTGLPTGLKLSYDQKKIYITTNDKSGIEVFDVATRKVVKKFTLNSETKKFRFTGGTPDPQDKFFYTVTTELTREIDRYEVGKPKYTVIDLNDGKIVKTVEVPTDEEGFVTGYRGASFEISPDGKYLYQFRDAVIILSTDDFKEVAKIDMAKPEDQGMEQIGFGMSLDTIGEPGFFVSMFNTSDPIVHNRIFGFAKFDLTKRTVEYKPIGPAPPTMAGLQVAPDKKSAYTIVTQGSLGNKRCEIWAFDLNSTKITKTQEVGCRSRFTFAMSSDGKKLYIYGAGFEFDVYDAATLKFEKKWDTGNDVTMGGLIALP